MKNKYTGYFIIALGIALFSLELYGLSFLELLGNTGYSYKSISAFLSDLNIILAFIFNSSIIILGITLVIIDYYKNKK